MNLIKILALTHIAVIALFAGDAAPRPLADDIFEKALEANAGDAIKAYSDYQTKLDAATKKVLVALESAKKDLNDTKRFARLSIQERAKTIEELDAKIAEVKKGSVGDRIAAKGAEKGDLPGEAKPDLTKIIVGNWNYTQEGSTWPLSFTKSGTIVGKKAWEEKSYKISGNMILIYTERDTLWTKFEYTDGRFVNPKDMSDCDWKKETLLTPMKK